MKRNGLKRGFSGLLALIMTVTMLLGLGIGEALFAAAEEPEGAEIVWDFEDGQLEPFKLVSGSYGTIISDIPWQHNAPTSAYPRQGNYHLSTLETTDGYTAETGKAWGDDWDKMTKPSDAYKCELHSPMFRLDDPEINFLVGGGPGGTKNTYVALCDMYGREVIRASGEGSENMIRVNWNLKYEELVGQYVFIKIVDGDNGGWGHLTFDDFHAVGYVDADMEVQPLPPNEIRWSFESGALAPFEVVEGEFPGTIITSWNTDRNAPYGLLNKDGDYYLCTVEHAEGIQSKFDEAWNGVIKSPNFQIKDPTVTMKVGGGYAQPDKLYVAIVRASDGEILAKHYNEAQPTYSYNGSETLASGHYMAEVSLTIPEADYVAGEEVYIKIVDAMDKGPYGYIIVDDIRAKGDVVNKVAVEIPTEYEDIAWDFESGTIAPFTTDPETDWGKVQFICDLKVDRNTAGLEADKQVPNNIQGNYFLQTILHSDAGGASQAAGTFTEGVHGILTSPDFVLDPEAPIVTMMLGGGTGNVVRIVDDNTGATLGEAHSKQNGWVMNEVSIDLTGKYTEGTVVRMELEDVLGVSYGFVCIDNIRFKGGIVSLYESIQWGFEDGTIAPFTTDDDWGAVTPFLISNRTVSNNNATLPLQKEGTYFLQTVMTHATDNQYDESVTGTFESPIVLLDPASPVVTVKLNGGGSNFFSVINANTGEVMGKAEAGTKATGDKWVFYDYTIDLTGKYTEGTPVYFELSDNTTKNWAFIGLDDVRFNGKLLDGSSYDFQDVIWSFENGTTLPFACNNTPNGGIISTYVQGQSATDSKIPHGKYYMNTVQTNPGDEKNVDEAWTGIFTSPKFQLNPEKPTITLSLVGGMKDCYVAVVNAATGAELARVSKTASSWAFEEKTLDLTGKISGAEKLVLKLVDANNGGGWSWFGVDNIRGSFYFPEAATLTTLKQVQAATGCTSEQWDKLIETVNNNIQNYGDEYPRGEEFLERIAQLQAKQSRMAKEGVKEDSPELDQLAADIAALIEEIKAANPVLGGGLMLVTVHPQYNRDHHNTHNMFPAYNGEISDKGAYTPGGAVRLVDLNTGKVTTLLEDADGTYRDLELSYDAKKVLLSYRDNRNTTYNIWEYDLGINEETGKYELTNPKQLTSLSTADDMDPLYLPSGQIVFSSTRDPKYVMCNRHIASNLYRMEADGANIIKITSSTLFERPTDVLPDGRIIYDRWEYNDRDFGSAQGLWTVYPDGTKQDTYYGNNSPSGATIEAKVVPGTEKVVATLSSTHDQSWGALAMIDRTKGVDGKAPVLYTWPASVKNSIRDTGAGNNIDQFAGLSIKYEDPQPLSEEYVLSSRYKAAGNAKMCIFLLDIYGNETLLYEDATNWGAWDATILAPREEEIALSERRNYNDDVGSFFVEDVYEGTHMQGIERGTVKTLRIVESMDKKYINQSVIWQAEGQENPGVNWHSFEVKRVIGEVPVYEDGSAYFEVPQDVFVYFQLLDEDGRMIQSMRSGTLVQSGEKTGCIGCHEDRRTAPMTYTGTETPMALKANVEVVPNPDYVEGSNLPKTIAVNTPDVPQKRILDFATGTDKLVDWNDSELFPEYTDLPTMNFLTEVQPVFTNNCLECHGYDKKEANLSLVPDKDVIFNAAYINLWVNRGKSGVYFSNLVGAIGGGNNAFVKAKGWGSYNSPLIKKIFEDEAHAARLTEAEKRRVAEWVDLNGTYYGDYSTNYGTNPGGRSPITGSERSALGDNRGLGWSSLTTGNLNKGIYFDNPEKSPILQGLTVGSDDYNNKLAIITAGRDRLRTNPDVDWKGLTTVPGNPSLKINEFKQCKMDQWRTDKVALVDAMEAANRAAIVAGTKLYDSDHEAVMAAHNAKWPGWPNGNGSDLPYTQLPG